MSVHKAFFALAAAGCLVLASCATPLDETQQPWALPDAVPLPPQASIEQPGTHPGAQVLTTGLQGSLRPDERTPEERVPRIIERGYLLVGVDQSQNLLSFRNPATGELEGFEVELAREIAGDIFGDPSKVDFRFVDSSDSVYALESKQVDIVIRAMTITRERQDQVTFSTPYFSAQTRMLSFSETEIESIADLAGKTVCVTDGSTALQRTRRLAPESMIMKVRSSADCLVALQQNQADVIVSDDAILSGVAAQDPYTRIVGDPIATEEYGIAMATPGAKHDTDGLVRQVNSTIARMREDGTWWMLYEQWLSKYQDTPGPPELAYRDEENEE